MLKLFLVCGPAEVGGISLLTNLGLLSWAVSVDAVRALYSSPAMEPSGEMVLRHHHDELVMSKVMEIVEQRMTMGETTFVAGDLTADQIKRYEKLSGQWGYSIQLINMCAPVSANDMGQLYDLVRAFERNVEDFTGKYREAVFVGDVHGCAAPLRRLLGKHFDEDKLFVFVGDLFDRGPENGEVFKMIMGLLAKPNVILMCGNHERHFLSWLNGRNVPGEFRNNTLPQLFKQGFDRTKAQQLLGRAQHLVQFRFKGANFQVSHGALAGVITRPALFPGYQCWRGVGKRTDLIDESFEQNAPADWYQVHGHSNALGRIITDGQRSFNLESSVEFGGKLSALAFDGTKFRDISVKSNVDSRAKKKSSNK